MGVEIKLTDRDLPVSPAFVDLLHRHIERKDFDSTWHDQVSEQLTPARFDEAVQAAVAVADQVLRHPLGQKAIYRSYELLTALLTGQTEPLRSLQERHRFICVVGCPRHGGTYLVKQLFLALGMDPTGVPNVLAHDGFPDATPFRLAERYNAFTAMQQQMAEYLAMVEVFFADARRHADYVVVPKKATKAAYHGAFFNAAFGVNAEYVITLRHPVAACISTYEKSSGLPLSGKFEVRSNIEQWAQRDNEFTGAARADLSTQDYFDVYLRYWELYHYNLALTGLLANRNRTIVVFGRDSLTALARDWCTRFQCISGPQDFNVFDYRDRHRAWTKQAEAAIRRVHAMWSTAGVAFPLDEVMESG